MSPTKILLGQGCLVVSIVVGGLWTSTQWAALMLGNQPELGTPLAKVLGQFGSNSDFRPTSQLLNQLRARDLVSASDRLSKELNLKTWQPMEGENISGTYLRPVTLASGKFAIVQRAHEFTLVPWQSQLEQRLGKSVRGTADANGISWDLGTRQRGLGIG
jgi:Protein of unknown function (DUF3363)